MIKFTITILVVIGTLGFTAWVATTAPQVEAASTETTKTPGVTAKHTAVDTPLFVQTEDRDRNED